MAPNVTIIEHDATLGEINGEVQSAQWTDDPDELRLTIAALADIARELAGQVDGQEAGQLWRRQHPWRSAISWMPWLCGYGAISTAYLHIGLAGGWSAQGAKITAIGLTGLAGLSAGVNALIKRVRRG